ncbi:MAG: hypothetical protein ACRELB_06500 [Polyangiaceae bacterium]
MDRSPLATLVDLDLDDPNDIPTAPGVCVWPEWAREPDDAHDTERPGEPVLEDPESWDSDEDTKRFRALA